MSRATAEQPLVVLCELCRERQPTTRAGAYVAAIDHALDFHRERLLAHPEQARKLFRVVHPGGKPARLLASPIGQTS